MDFRKILIEARANVIPLRDRGAQTRDRLDTAWRFSGHNRPDHSADGRFGMGPTKRN